MENYNLALIEEDLPLYTFYFCLFDKILSDSPNNRKT